MTQGDPLFPTIFNVVLDEVVCHWELLVAERAEGDSSNNTMSQPADRAIWESNNGQQWIEEGHTGLKAKASFF